MTQAFKTKESLAGLVRLPLFWKFQCVTLCKGPIACFLKLYLVCLLYGIILNVQVSEVCLICLGHAYIVEHTFILAYIILLREMLTVNIITDCNISITVFRYAIQLLKLVDSLFHHLQSTLYVLRSEAVISSGEAAMEREKNLWTLQLQASPPFFSDMSMCCPLRK